MNLATRLRTFAAPAVGLALGAALCLAATPAFAQQPAADAAPPPVRMAPIAERNDTRALLQIQRSGAQAGPGLPMTGEQAALGYERYLESFRYAIPEYFTSQATGSPLRGGSGSQSFGQALGQ